MKRFLKIWAFSAVLIITFLSQTTEANVDLIMSAPVDHPASRFVSRPTPYVWRMGTSAWGESLARENMALRGYNEIYEIKRPNGQGIDLVTVKRDAAGRMKHVKIVEVKTHRGKKAKLGSTKYGKQMSARWLAAKFHEMRSSPNPVVQNLRREIRQFRRAQHIPLAQLGEVHEVNTRTGSYIRRNPTSGGVLSDDSVVHYLKRIQAKAPSIESRKLAARSLASWNQISGTNMTQWLNPSRAMRSSAINRIGASRVGRVTGNTASRALKVLARAAGPIGAAVGISIDAYEIYSSVAAYQRGDISRRELNIVLSASGGGITGAAAGAASGAWLGTFGGPLAWFTIPAGGIIGGAVGYFAGSAAGGSIAQAWYTSIDDNVKSGVDRWILQTSFRDAELQNAGRNR